MLSDDFQRILLIKPSSAGDVLHALPVLRAVRRRFPRAHIAWLVGTAFANLLEAEPGLDEVIPFDRHYYARLLRAWRPTRDFLRFVRELRGRRFDLVIDLQGLFRSGYLALTSGAATRIGFRDSRELAWTFYTHRLQGRRAELHAVDRNLEVLDLLGIERGAIDLRPATTEEDAAAVGALLGRHGVALAADGGCGPDLDCGTGFQPVIDWHSEAPAGSRRHNSVDASSRLAAGYIAMAPSSRWETKQWPAERFGELALRLRERYGLTSVLVGGRGDRATADRAGAASSGAAINLCGETTLRQLAVLIASARLVVANDSLPMHLAAAYGRPLTAFFGPTHPRRTGPHGRLDDVLRLDLPCSPCYLRRERDCPYELKCMRGLTTDAVLSAAAARLETGGAGAVVE